MIINFLDKVICHANLDSFIPFGHAVTHADLYIYLLIWRYIIRQIHNNICVSGLTNICPACILFSFDTHTIRFLYTHTQRNDKWTACSTCTQILTYYEYIPYYMYIHVHWLNKGNCIYIVYYTFCTPLFYTNYFFKLNV